MYEGKSGAQLLVDRMNQLEEENKGLLYELEAQKGSIESKVLDVVECGGGFEKALFST